MGDFSLMGGVGIMGVLTPMDTRDDYAVTDPVYGVDGLRNVASTSVRKSTKSKTHQLGF